MTFKSKDKLRGRMSWTCFQLCCEGNLLGSTYRVIALIFLSLLFEMREDLFELNEKEAAPKVGKKIKEK